MKIAQNISKSSLIAVLVLFGAAIVIFVSSILKTDISLDIYSKKKIEYQYSNVIPSEYIITQAPELPELSPYTIEAVMAKKKSIKPGYSLIQKFQDGYRRMHRNIDFFAEKQNRSEPVIITIADGVYDLETLTKEIANPDLLEKKDDGFYLYVPLTIRDTGMLIVEEATLKLSATHGSMINNFGNVLAINAEILGWDVTQNKGAWFKDRRHFRPYITNWCGSKMNMAGTKVSHLGYQESKSYGITYTSCQNTFYQKEYGHLPGGTGWLIDNKFIDIYFGFYSYEADHVRIIGNEYIDNIVYGIDPHDRSEHLIIAYNKVSGTKKRHGIIGSRAVNNSYIIHNHTENNRGSGIMLDRSSNNNIIAHNLSQNNGADGITFFESANNISFNNSYINNQKSGFRIRNSWGITSYRDVINNNVSAAVEVYTSYLKIEETRDLGLDPYTQRAEGFIIEPEIIGNKIANFKVKDFDKFILYHPKFFQLPNKQFSSQDNALSSTLEAMVNGSQTEIYANQKGKD